ncbi:MAG: N-acetylgalactosamine-6-sulfatase [Planctomycetaceae bacterium]|nr:N-acetylgalactosamine-6-sulfatase [Planctomycetaceae bacterium]
MNTHTSIAPALIALSLSATVLPAAEAAPPNVVFIMADDLGYSELGSYGQKKIRTPNIDRLASQGMRFTRNYSGNAVCAPSRCVLMTGRHPGHAWVRSNLAVKPEGQTPIPDSDVTVAELFQQAGYATGAFGKWGLGPPSSQGDPLHQGFDRFFGYNCQSHAHSYYPSYLWSDKQRIPLNNNPPVPGHASLKKGADPSDPASFNIFKGQDYAPDRINQQALAFLRANKDRPFFLYYPTVIPHVALHVPDEELKPYLALGWNDPPFTRGKGYGYTPHFTPRAAYAAMITRMDRYIGRVLEELKKLGLDENTIVVFTSDNGTTHLKEEVDYDFFQSVKPLRGLKGSLYEGGVRVPLIVRWPGRVKAGSTSDFVTGFEDWLPTLVDLAGVNAKVPAEVDGVSLKETLLGNKQAERPFLYREFPSYGGQQAVWMGRWKGIRQNMAKRNNAKPLNIELYDLHADASESRDVAAERPEVVAQIRKLMAEQHTPSELFPIKVID